MKELTSIYDILKVLGHGGFSAVFKARRKSDGKIVALKQLDITIVDENQKEYRDFKEEVEILKKLDHPNIVKVFAENILDHKPSLEMEYLEGETLETIIKNTPCFSIDETMNFIEQVSSALNYCHHYYLPDSSRNTESAMLKRSAIVHNDINPKNIIRIKNEDGSFRYVLIDFGLSFTDPNSVRHSKKEEGMAEYKAPEKWMGGVVDTPTDIYSLGTVIYELLTGLVPFPVKNYKEIKDMLQLEENHKTASVPDMCEKRMTKLKELSMLQSDEFIFNRDCDIPHWLEILVEKCLKKNPDNRFKNGRELSSYFFDGKDGKIKSSGSDKTAIIEIDPFLNQNKIVGTYIQVIPNFLTTEQQFFIQKNTTTIGRWNDMPGAVLADFAIVTADKFISKNHCQIIKKQLENGETIYQLADTAPSKNGTFYNTEKNSHRLEPHIKVTLKDGDYFWVGNTKIVFHTIG